MSLGLTLGAIVFMVIILGLVAVLPPLLKAVFGTGALRWVLQIIGWLIMVVLVAAALALLYRLGPDRDAPRMAWVSVGAVVATLLCWPPRSGSRSMRPHWQLRQDLWRIRRNRRPAVLALAHHVRDLARRPDQC